MDVVRCVCVSLFPVVCIAFVAWFVISVVFCCATLCCVLVLMQFSLLLLICLPLLFVLAVCLCFE